MVTSAGIGTLAGLIAGFVWGGIGGRIAMRVLFLTSHDAVKGMTSDDLFEIGVISAATIFLLIFTSMAGGFGGFIYGLIRPALRGPLWLVASGMGIAMAAGIGGGMVIKSEGIDFVVLTPLSLAVALFLIIPAGWGVTVVLLTERLMRPNVLRRNRLLTAPPPGLQDPHGGLVVAAAAWLLLGAITVAGTVDLAKDLARLT